MTRFLVLPRTCDSQESWDELIDKSKAFRLQSLRESPDAFASTLENEQIFACEIWEGRLANPCATAVVAVSVSTRNKASDLDVLLESEWLASTVLLRPLEDEVEKLSASASPWSSVTEEREERGKMIEDRRVLFVLNGVYVIPKARGYGVGVALLKASLEIGNKMVEGEGAVSAGFQVRVDAANTAAVKLYEKAGFKISLTETIVMKKNAHKTPPPETIVYVMER
ncbi:hypothetical protein EJ08DRAFT_646838 [Tothia fuscella]|uniref:N-acetyltransferase domain-containing protein n=1 Tax=Tothia fuscella TaxID=1048955 RepID=A0A9P4U1W7_9PEZI|nr:hypothetical protein EJ08DRAFT_646838 [Tothia fuscella]